MIKNVLIPWWQEKVYTIAWNRGVYTSLIHELENQQFEFCFCRSPNCSRSGPQYLGSNKLHNHAQSAHLREKTMAVGSLAASWFCRKLGIWKWRKRGYFILPPLKPAILDHDFGCSCIEDGYPGGPLSILGQLRALIRRLSPDFETEPASCFLIKNLGPKPRRENYAKTKRKRTRRHSGDSTSRIAP